MTQGATRDLKTLFSMGVMGALSDGQLLNRFVERREGAAFEAIDEPWKSNQNNTNPSDPQGFMGAEGHYGVWSYTTNNDSGSFVAKWTIGS